MIKLAAVMIIRNEADLLEVNLRYHAAQGVTEFRIVDKWLLRFDVRTAARAVSTAEHPLDD
jgi:hypothetical protein